MSIEVLFFGATAHLVGKRRINVSIEGFLTALELVLRLKKEYPKLEGHKLMFAINQEYVAADHVLQSGDECAIFTAVSGG